MHIIPDAARFAAAKVLVCGDVMLDRYWFGDVSRISPEAPVPVAKIGKTDNRAGGAANVARNIAAMGGQATLLSVCGNDEAADILQNLLQNNGVATLLHRSDTHPTTLKLRVLARNQQLIRLDFEESPDAGSLKSMTEQYAAIVQEYDAVVLSDYGKGVLADVPSLIQAAKVAGKPVLIDPKGSDYAKYAAATLLTPNRAELKEAVGGWDNEHTLTEKAQNLRRQLNLDALLLTRSEEGMSLYQHDSITHQPTRAQEVYDVSGAGDTVIATAALCLAAGYTLPQAMHTANAAAGIVVAKLGTAVCSFAELTAALAREAA